MLEILRSELEVAMGLTGMTDVRHLDRDALLEGGVRERADPTA